MLIAAHSVAVGAALVTSDRAFYNVEQYLGLLDWTNFLNIGVGAEMKIDRAGVLCAQGASGMPKALIRNFWDTQKLFKYR